MDVTCQVPWALRPGSSSPNCVLAISLVLLSWLFDFFIDMKRGNGYVKGEISWSFDVKLMFEVEDTLIFCETPFSDGRNEHIQILIIELVLPVQ